MAYLKKAVLISIFSFGITLVAYANCDQIYNNCIQTAANNYADGSISYNLYQDFINDHCPGAFESCHQQ